MADTKHAAGTTHNGYWLNQIANDIDPRPGREWLTAQQTLNGMTGTMIDPETGHVLRITVETISRPGE